MSPRRRGTAVLILAAGRGTRMQSRLPKVLHRAGGRTLLEHVLAAVSAAGVDAADVAVVAGYDAEAVAAAAGRRAVVQEPQLGTGHAVQCAQDWWSGYDQVVVLNGDMPLISPATVRALIAGRGEAAAVVATACPSAPRAYGRIIRTAGHPTRIEAIVEHAQATAEQRRIKELNAGFYCFSSEALTQALTHLNTANPHSEYYLTDVVAILAGQDRIVSGLELEDADECLGINDRAELAALDLELRRRKARQLLARGVSLQLPDTIVVDPEVEVGADSMIEAGAQLLGHTRIGSGCHVGAASIVIDCEIADGVIIQPHCMLEAARVHTGAIVGPFARLRPGAEIGRKAHVGNFVEVKNTHLGDGSKANHLAYLGDAVIGSGVNIGAGTITCNYDGRHKHTTKIGAGSFVGSNATLVAPVEIGEGAFVAAGSVITEDLPADALGLGRARQQNKPGWAAKRRP